MVVLLGQQFVLEGPQHVMTMTIAVTGKNCTLEVDYKLKPEFKEFKFKQLRNGQPASLPSPRSPRRSVRSSRGVSGHICIDGICRTRAPYAQKTSASLSMPSGRPSNKDGEFDHMVRRTKAAGGFLRLVVSTSAR